MSLNSPTRAAACVRAARRAGLPVVLLCALSLLPACADPAADAGASAATATDPTSANAAGAPAPASDGANATLSAPMQAMVIGLMSRAQAEGRDFGPAFAVPATWVFDPQGRLHERVEDAGALSSLDAAGFRSRDASAGGNALSLDSVLAAVSEHSAAPVSADGRWTVLTLLANRGCEDTCPRFADQARALAADPAADVRSIVLTLEH